MHDASESFVMDQCEFLSLIQQSQIKAPLKSYVDSILFYYLGYLALTQTDGALSEIGTGGSTYPLMELSHKYHREFLLFDINAGRIERFCEQNHWPKTKLIKITVNSVDLHNRSDLPEFSYCHIDGSKNLNTTKSDLRFYLDRISHNGLICQDDYGNNKWPTVTDAVQDLQYNGELKLLVIGDSSAWITLPKYYDFWMDVLCQDREFALLRSVCNIVDSAQLDRHPRYYFVQSCLSSSVLDGHTEDEKKYFARLTALEPITPVKGGGYLKMPYPSQGAVGTALSDNYVGSKLSFCYDQLRGDQWPQDTPYTLEQARALPKWIQDEIQTLHKIDLFEPVVLRKSDRKK